MFVDAAPTHPSGMFSLRWIIDQMMLLPPEVVQRLATHFVEQQRKTEALEGPERLWSPSKIIERRLALAKDDAERLMLTLWAGLWIGEIPAVVLHLASCRCYATELSAWDPHLDSIRDLRESIIGGVFLGPAVPWGDGALDQELIRRPILISREAARRLTKLTLVSESELRKQAEWLVAEQMVKSDGPMLQADFVAGMLQKFGRRILKAGAEYAWRLYTPKEWKNPGRRKRRPKRS